jgi:hypothetical protein
MPPVRKRYLKPIPMATKKTGHEVRVAHLRPVVASPRLF